MTAAKEADKRSTSTALVLKGEEDSLSRGQRLRREKAGVLLFANQASKLSGMFKLHEVIVEMKIYCFDGLSPACYCLIIGVILAVFDLRMIF